MVLYLLLSFTVTTHSVWQASSILMTPENKSSYTCETPFNNSFSPLFVFFNLWIRMIGFIILISVCFSKEPWTKVMVHLNSKPNYNGKVKICGGAACINAWPRRPVWLKWVFLQWAHQSGKLSLNLAKSVTASSGDKEVTSVCFIWCVKRFDVILDDLYCCFNKSQLLFFSIFISLLLIKLLEYCWCSGIESNHIWFAINVSYYYFISIKSQHFSTLNIFVYFRHHQKIYWNKFRHMAYSARQYNTCTYIIILLPKYSFSLFFICGKLYFRWLFSTNLSCMRSVMVVCL